MTRRVCIVGCGTTKFTRSADVQIESILLNSVKNLSESIHLEMGDVDAVFVANAAGGYDNYDERSSSGSGDAQEPGMNARATTARKRGSGYMAAILAELAGMRPRAAHTVESLCSSGSNALVSGYAHVASGLADVALVSGAETADTRGRVLWWDDSRGEFKHPTFWASIMTRSYKRRHGITGEDLAVIPARAHANALANPDALPSGRPYTVQDVMDSESITGDLRMLDCSRPCTGGASVLVTSEDVASRYTDSPVWITGIGQYTTSAGFAKTRDPSRVESARAACRDALEMAQRNHTSRPGGSTLGIRDIDVAEIHDAFSVCEPIILEAMGIAQEGRGAHESAILYETQSRRINPRGGLLGSGHPLGATGVAQAAEIARQLWLEAGSRQADSPEVGMVHNMAAAGTSSTVLVMQR